MFHLALFTMPPVAHHSLGTWKDPRNLRRGYHWSTGEPWMHVAKLAERAAFDFVFAADVECIYDVHGGSYEPAVRYGIQTPSYDQTVVLSYMAAATRNIGVVSTLTTLGSVPYVTARKFATLDNLSGGRVGWNVVAGAQKASARNVGLPENYKHDERYERAEEYLELCYRLWDSWEEDAIVADAENDVFADPKKVHAINFEGRYYRSAGPLNVNRSPQGRPVIAQAGTSERGLDFGAKHGEVLFSLQPFPEGMKWYRDELRERAATKFGRDPDTLKVYYGFQPFVGETEEIARQKADRHNALISPEAGLAMLSGHMGYDLSQHPLDEPIERFAELEVPGSQGTIDMYTRISNDSIETLADIGRMHGRSVGAPQVVGTAEQIADWMQETMEFVGGDGFMLSPAYLPGSVEEFVDLVVPVLQDRGLVRSEYVPGGLRDNVMAF
jgi:FMN-dependent oxidoreductase (nitrilotriacetate monooxygenase family)